MENPNARLSRALGNGISDNTIDSIMDELQNKEERIPNTAEERRKSEITINPVAPTQKVETEEDKLAAAFPELQNIDQSSEKISEKLHEKQNEIDANEDSSNDDVIAESLDDIIEAVSGVNSVKPDEKPESAKTYEEILAEYEAAKMYSSYEPNEEQTGPSEYIVEYDNSYMETVSDILENNGITVAKVSNNEKKEILNRYTNSGPCVSLTLPNSGIFVTISGAGIDELVAMASINHDTLTRTQAAKIKYICDHVVNSSVGPLTVVQLMNIVSYYDIPTLYYALFAATHPENVELEKHCPDCRNPYYVKVNTRDLLLNYKDYEKTDRYIKDNVTTYAQLKNASRLSKIYTQKVSDSMIIYYKHPSIASFINTLNQISDDKMKEFPDIAPYAFCISKIALKSYNRSTSEDKFVEYDDPDSIIDIIGKSKNPELKYTIEDIIDRVKECEVPEYGFHKCKCPHCGRINPEESVLMDELLFTSARAELTISTLRRAVVIEQRKKNKHIFNA